MYRYEDFRGWLFTDEGQRAFVAFRDRALRALRETGAFTVEAVVTYWNYGPHGPSDNWSRIACADRMVEMGELVRIQRPGRISNTDIFTAP